MGNDIVTQTKQWWLRLSRRQYFWLLVLVIVTLVLHFTIITRPPQPIFDEIYYVTDARSIIEGNGTLRPEHPPLCKLFIVSGIQLFGDNPLGWRFFSVVFGTINIVLFYFICGELAMPRKAQLFATYFLAFETLSFVQASVAMLDVYSLTFMLAAFLLYLKSKYLASGLSIGLATLAKLTGGLGLIAIFIHWLAAKRSKPRRFTALIMLGPASFMFLLPLFNLPIFGKLTNPVEQLQTMLTILGSKTFDTITHPALSYPWEWILNPKGIGYWADPNYLAMISFNLWVLIIPVVVYMFYKAAKGNNAALFGVSWFSSTYLAWIPLSLITNRASYSFYFYPTIGSICIGLGLGFYQLMYLWQDETQVKLKKRATGAVISYLVTHLAVFVIISPVFSRWATPLVGFLPR